MKEKGISQGQLVTSTSKFIKRNWRILIQCSFLTAIFLELSSVIVLHLNLVAIHSAGLVSAVHISMLLVLTLMILGIVGFILANSDAVKDVKERYKSALQESFGTDSYYHVWSDMTREIKMAESITLKGLNSLLLAATIIAGLFSFAYMLSTFPIPHPFYQIMATQMLSIFLAVVFLYGRRANRKNS